MPLAFLSIIAVRPAFYALRQEPAVQSNTTLAALLTYFETTWLNGTFRLSMWNIRYPHLPTYLLWGTSDRVHT